MHEPGDLIKVGEVIIPYYCEWCGCRVGIRHTLYNAGIASPLDDWPLKCPECHFETEWLAEEEARG